MSAQQQALVVETVLAIRRTLKRKAYDSDSDSSIDQNTNRGNKLKKKARFVRQGRLTSATGPAAYKEVAEHAGHQRAIINHNPPLIDEEGYDIDSYDDEEQVQEAIASAMEDNPYSFVRLEQLLAPLTAVTDLPAHPTLSRPFTSRALAELIEQARNLMQKENAALWKAKPLLTKLVGDHTWAPCGLITAPGDRDALLFSDTASFFNRAPRTVAPEISTAPSVNEGGTAPGDTSTESAQPGTRLDAPEAQGTTAQSVGATEQDTASGERPADRETLPEAPGDKGGEREPGQGTSTTENPEKGAQVNGRPGPGEESKDAPVPAGGASGEPNTTGGEDREMAEAPGASTQEPRDAPRPPAPVEVAPAASPAETADELFIHPLFRLPRAAHPDRDLGLPEQEAEEVRRVLLLYVQKQEEICRGAKRLYEGLLRADRYRRTVWRWAKAEAHCGPNRDMSDGEDWYDRDEWGLTEDLKKGEDEVEEDTAQTQKKTRNRK